MKVIKLPFSTGLTGEGVKFRVEEENISFGLTKVTIDYDYLAESKTIWVQINFSGVIAYKFTREAACSAEMIVPGFVDLGGTNWLNETRKEWGNSFSGERKKEMYGKFDFNHYLIYFDNIGCYEIIARKYDVKKVNC